jgi:predicted small secreted protein
MRYLLLLAALSSLVSCNTMIGIGRDTKQGYQWTRDKIQGNSNNFDPGSSSNNNSGAPVY